MESVPQNNFTEVQGKGWRKMRRDPGRGREVNGKVVG